MAQVTAPAKKRGRPAATPAPVGRKPGRPAATPQAGAPIASTPKPSIKQAIYNYFGQCGGAGKADPAVAEKIARQVNPATKWKKNHLSWYKSHYIKEGGAE